MVEKEESKKDINKSLGSEEIHEGSDKSSTKNIMLILIMIIGLLILFFSIKYFYHPISADESYVYN